MFRFLSKEDIDKTVDPLELIFVIKDLYIKKPLISERTSLEFRDIWIGLMPGIDPETGFVLKIIGIYPRADPRVRGYVIISDLENGGIKAVLDASAATGWRTATTSALVTKLLMDCGLEKRCDIDVLGLIGAGFQGEYHVNVFRRLFNVKKIIVYDVDKFRLERFVNKMNVETSDHKDLLKRSDVIIVATNSIKPVVSGDLLKKDSIIISIGAPRPVNEIDDETRRRAGCALVDTLYGVLNETDDVKGLELVELGEYLSGKRCLFRELRLYKSVGTVVQDIAFARYILRKI